MTPRSFMLAALAPAALALVLPHAAHASDPRIREVAYTPLSVTALHGCAGFQSTVAFEPGERIENVALGDAKLWDAVPNKRSDLLFLKPAVHSGRTNMMVVTDRRRYAFDLIARDDAGCRADRATYELQFTYAADPTPPAPPTLADITPPALAALAPRRPWRWR
ncbi:MAG: TrbG/VirB9 family P-type conjugative transfer protein [Caulobacteraceae bacterium]